MTDIGPWPLPVDAWVPKIRDALRRARAAVVVAAPGAGKTTRIPPALIGDGPVILLQPRRVAARAIAGRIARERQWTLGRQVGWQVRFERRFGPGTSLLVATEGILTARLQQDPLLSAFTTIVLDEFHERSIHADLGIALAKQAWRARDDLRILVMSATLDAERAAAFLDGCPVFDIPGTVHPLEIGYRPGASVADAAAEILGRTPGQVLCFLPGAGEVRRAATALRQRLPPGTDVVELHGSLPADEQDRALAPAPGRRVIVATNIAETSLTVPGVTGVVDSGYHKVARYDAGRAVDSLDLERISRDAADQRAGRAGRTAPGVVLRLWNEADRLRPHREADITRIDLSGPVLDVLAWGGDPASLDWFEPPPAPALASALDLLRALGAVEGGQLTALGRRMAALPVHPRLARILVAADGAADAALACALLSDRMTLPRHPPTTSCDLRTGTDGDLPPHVRQAAQALQRACGDGAAQITDEALRRALLAGYPDRVARRREPGSPRVLLASGHGAAVGPESGVRDGEFLLAIDVQAGRRGEQSEATIRIASVVEKAWLEADTVEVVHDVRSDGEVRTVERHRYGALVLRERPVATDPAVAAAHLARVYLERPLPDHDARILRRLRYAGLADDLPELAQRAAAGRRKLTDVRLEDAIDWTMRRRLEAEAPASLKVPSGRTHALDYRADGTVVLAVKLQELFGLKETPRIGLRRDPVVLELLAPNGRPIQTTRDLESFWNTTYPEVRRELRARYPRHPWPEDPWNATPTARTKKGMQRP